jgi:hypothetical protein
MRSPPRSTRPAVCRPGGGTTSRSISALTATISSAPLMRSSTAVSGGSTSATSTGGVRQHASLGLYAEAVQQQGYRDAKIRAVLDTVPDILGPTGDELDLRWRGPSGHEHRGGLPCLCPTMPTGSAAHAARARAPD